MKKKLALIMAGLLCVASLVSCKSSNPSEEKQKEETPEVAEDTRDHSKMIIAISESQKEFYTMAITKYVQLHPETEIDIEVIPHMDNAPTEENEKIKKEMKDMQVQIMAGKGPDVFLLDEENIVLPDMVKSSYNGVFLDLNTVIEGLADMPLNQTVLKAGEVDGKQYFLPLGYMLPGIAVTGEMLGDWTPSSDQPDKFLKEVSSHTGVKGFPSEFYITEYIAGLFGTSVFDYEEKTITFSKELQNMTELLAERQELSFDEATELPNVMIMGHSAESSLTELMKRSFASGTDVKFLPFPNGEKGVNAQVNVFAAVRANSDYASQAGDFLGFLLSDEVQGSTGWEKFGDGKKFTAIPVNNNAVVPAYKYWLSSGTEEYQEEAAKKAEELFQITQQVTTARFCQYENSLIFDAVFMTSEESSVEKKLDNLKDELRFYFDE